MCTCICPLPPPLPPDEIYYGCRTATALSTAKGQLQPLLRLLPRGNWTLLFCPHGPLCAGIGTSTHTADIHLHYYYYHYFIVASFRQPITYVGGIC